MTINSIDKLIINGSNSSMCTYVKYVNENIY